MTDHDFVPPGHAIEAVAPRPGALTTITERVRERRRRKRNRAVAGLVLAVTAAAPLLLAVHDSTVGLQPTHPTASPSASQPGTAHTERGFLGYGGGETVPTPAPPYEPTPTPAPSEPAPPAYAPPSDGTGSGDGTLTVTGSESGYALVHVDRPTTVDLAGLTYSSFGDYTGVAVGGVEVLYARGMEDGRSRPAYRGATSVTLPAGVHRIYLFTSAGDAATVTLPWSAPSLTVQPVQSVRVRTMGTQEMFAQDRSGKGDGFGEMTAATVGIAAAVFDPAPTSVSLDGCLTVDVLRRTCVHTVTATSDGTSVRLRDRVTGRYPVSNEYTVTVHKGSNVASPGLLRVLLFSYDRD